MCQGVQLLDLHSEGDLSDSCTSGRRHRTGGRLLPRGQPLQGGYVWSHRRVALFGCYFEDSPHLLAAVPELISITSVMADTAKSAMVMC